MFHSDSEEEVGSRRPAFPIPPEPLSKLEHDGPPATAAEYLRLVRQESAALPNIFISKTPAPPAKKRKRSYLPSPIPQAPRHMQPDPQWQRDLVYWFAELQRTVAYLPSADQIVPGASDKKFWELSFQKRPKLTMLRSMDYVHKLRVLRLIDESVTIIENEDSSSSVAVQSVVSPSLAVGRLAEWIFCLLSFVQPPISGEIEAVIRSLLRKVAIDSWHVDINMQDTHHVYNHNQASVLSVLRTILGKYFRQEDVQ